MSHRCEEGTSALEAVLNLPFLMLLLLLGFNLCYGALVRMHADGASRFAGTWFMDRVDRKANKKDSYTELGKKAVEAMRAAYYPTLAEGSLGASVRQIPFNVSFSPPADAGAPPSGDKGFFGKIKDWFLEKIGRAEVTFSVPLDAPVGSADVEPRTWGWWDTGGRLHTYFLVSSNSLAYHREPLSIQAITDSAIDSVTDKFGPFGGVLSGVLSFLKGLFFKLLGWQP